MAPSLDYTPISDIDTIHARLLKTFESGKTRPLAYRRHQLLQLARLAQDNASAIEAALFTDLNKPRFEARTSEITVVASSALHAAEHLDEWAKPEKPEVPAWRSSWDATAYKAPKGLALIIAPWNYPFITLLDPLVGAISAGCTCVLKPSEITTATSQLVTALVAKYLDPDAYIVVNGGVPETTALLTLRWAHIFYTGGVSVGRIVAAAAAKFVTPLTLELGGKSPIIIDPNFDDLDLAAKRILNGKLQNSGQLCITPDYALVPRAKVDAFIASLIKVHDAFLPNGPLHKNVELSKIVTPSHHARLRDLLARTKGKIVFGGQYEGDRRIAPTIVKDVPVDDALMENEIFGPILPVIAVDDVDHAISIVRQFPIPLVVYAFTNSEEVKNKLLETTQSGALVLNDTVSHLAVTEIPFGGQGDSGYGGYHGKASFDTFTQVRMYMNLPPSEESRLSSRYRPFDAEKLDATVAAMQLKIPVI